LLSVLFSPLVLFFLHMLLCRLYVLYVIDEFIISGDNHGPL
jgi:hypothetical protein